VRASDAQGGPPGPARGGEGPSQSPLSRGEIVILIQEVERMQTRFANRNNTSWVRACDTLLGNCRKLLAEGQGVQGQPKS
jgi:hypothetical protein